MADTEGYVDAHVHALSLAFSRYPVRTLIRWDEIPRDSGVENLFRILDGGSVTQMVLVQSPQYGDDHSLVFDLRNQYPERFAVVPVIDWKAPNARKVMEEYKNRAVRGVRIYPMAGDDLKSWLQYPQMQALWREAERLKMAVCCLIDVDSLPSLKRQCQQFLNVTVVIDHLCRIGAYRNIKQAEVDALCDLAQFEGVHVKASAFGALSGLPGDYTDLLQPLLLPVLNAFGHHRVVFGTDFPFFVEGCHYTAAVKLISDHQHELGLDNEGCAAVMGGTARKLFF